MPASRVSSVVLSAALFICTLPPAIGAVDHPVLAGAWTLNRQQSSAPGAGRRSEGTRDGEMPRRGRAGGGMGGAGMGAPGPGRLGGGGGTPDREEMQRRRELLQEVLEPPTRLTITVDDPVVTFTYGDGRVVRYRADGRKEKHQATAGTVETKTRWMPDRLEIETDLGQGTKVTHTYALHEADRQLVLTVALAGGSRDRSPASFVYDDATMPQ